MKRGKVIRAILTTVVIIVGGVVSAWLGRSYGRRFGLWLLDRGASFLTIKIAGAFVFLVLYYSLCILPLLVLYRGWSRAVRLWLVAVTFFAACMLWTDVVIRGQLALGAGGWLDWAGIFVLGIGMVGLMLLADRVGQRLGVRPFGERPFGFARKWRQ